MKYMQLYEDAKIVNAGMENTVNTFYEYLALKLSFFLTPFFIMLNVSANTVSVICLFVGLVSAGFIMSGGTLSLPIGIAIYFFNLVLDACDGNVARMTKTSTFFGRFIDGVIDMTVLLAIQIAFVWVVHYQCHNEILLWVGILSAIVTPFHHLYYDRYSAFVRWINEEHDMNIVPYIRRNYFMKLDSIINHINYSCLVVIAALFFFNIQFWEYVLFLYFSVHIVNAVFNIWMHTISASRNMRVSSKRKY